MERSCEQQAGVAPQVADAPTLEDGTPDTTESNADILDGYPNIKKVSGSVGEVCCRFETCRLKEDVLRALRNAQKEENVAGFRRGFVPMWVIEEKYEASFIQKECERAFSRLFATTVRSVYKDLRFCVYGFWVYRDEACQQQCDTMDSLAAMPDVLYVCLRFEVYRPLQLDELAWSSLVVTQAVVTTDEADLERLRQHVVNTQMMRTAQRVDGPIERGDYVFCTCTATDAAGQVHVDQAKHMLHIVPTKDEVRTQDSDFEGLFLGQVAGRSVAYAGCLPPSLFAQWSSIQANWLLQIDMVKRAPTDSTGSSAPSSVITQPELEVVWEQDADHPRDGAGILSLDRVKSVFCGYLLAIVAKVNKQRLLTEVIGSLKHLCMVPAYITRERVQRFFDALYAWQEMFFPQEMRAHPAVFPCSQVSYSQLAQLEQEDMLSALQPDINWFIKKSFFVIELMGEYLPMTTMPSDQFYEVYKKHCQDLYTPVTRQEFQRMYRLDERCMWYLGYLWYEDATCDWLASRVVREEENVDIVSMATMPQLCLF